MNPVLSAIGQRLARYLSKPRPFYGVGQPTQPELLEKTLRPGDVILVEGNTRISTAIKYLTQSTWSHAALYIGELGTGRLQDEAHSIVEADVVQGVRSASLSQFDELPTRICRPMGLNERECATVCDFAIARLGHRYDLKNVIDLARYLMPTPPVPVRFRRRMIALGSGDPTRAICSTLIAEAFQSIGYPVLPQIGNEPEPTEECPDCMREIWRIRHHSLYAPRDFDVSPYFSVVKPAIAEGFDFHGIEWAEL
ncbi:MAG: lipo-like protein [Alphaproteobacteria bacterium]|nr:lipo-like protein [Alphaproteobacteria bacterium]